MKIKFKRIQVFLNLVFRQGFGGRLISPKVAWQVALIYYPKVQNDI